MGRSTDVRLNLSSPTEFLLQNIPSNVSFILFQVHSQYVNVTLSVNKIPNINDSETGNDAGLITMLRTNQTVCTWYLQTSYPDTLLASAITIPYTERNPIPGACNLEFSLDVDPNVYLQYNLYETIITFAPANLGHARYSYYPPLGSVGGTTVRVTYVTLPCRNATPPACDVQTGQESRWRLQYDVFQYFLPENNLNESVLLAHLQKMSLVPQISANGVKQCNRVMEACLTSPTSQLCVRPAGDYATFRNDSLFWLTFTCIALMVPACLLPFPKTVSILYRKGVWLHSMT
ncbi:hypothetical protein GDO78_013638 [Eleutherodactylus coqui]|uniref:Uncharacterized protein n=1 Tax=Eleutherodactylus coqui TaxID=57060 RepID=A0A8J6E760_ELECQ|nr:hypothetical protein GDO78_013638 [Eleutherodactylus coqui]